MKDLGKYILSLLPALIFVNLLIGEIENNLSVLEIPVKEAPLFTLTATCGGVAIAVGLMWISDKLINGED